MTVAPASFAVAGAAAPLSPDVRRAGTFLRRRLFNSGPTTVATVVLGAALAVALWLVW